MSERKTSSNGLGFTGALTILFIGLKLGKVINWSWWWVLSPIWISALLAIVVIGIVIGVKVIADNRRRKAPQRAKRELIKEIALLCSKKGIKTPSFLNEKEIVGLRIIKDEIEKGTYVSE